MPWYGNGSWRLYGNPQKHFVQLDLLCCEILPLYTHVTLGQLRLDLHKKGSAKRWFLDQLVCFLSQLWNEDGCRNAGFMGKKTSSPWPKTEERLFVLFSLKCLPIHCVLKDYFRKKSGGQLNQIRPDVFLPCLLLSEVKNACVHTCH